MRRACANTSRRPAFTLVEVLVVIAVTATLISLAMPTISHALGAAKRARCLANLHSFGHALTLYRSDHHELYPDASAVISLPLRHTVLLEALAGYVDAPTPSLGDDGACRSTAPYRCPADRDCAPVHGASYLYDLGEIIEVLAIDGEREPARAATRLADNDPSVTLLSDVGDRELRLLGDVPRWHDGGPVVWRNALYSDGRASRMTLQPAAQSTAIAAR